MVYLVEVIYSGDASTVVTVQWYVRIGYCFLSARIAVYYRLGT